MSSATNAANAQAAAIRFLVASPRAQAALGGSTFTPPFTGLFAVPIGANGAGPFGINLLPQIYLSGNSEMFLFNLGSGTSFTQTSFTDNHALTANGSLQNAASDPFVP